MSIFGKYSIQPICAGGGETYLTAVGVAGVEPSVVVRGHVEVAA
jgi:hypothetical protein